MGKKKMSVVSEDVFGPTPVDLLNTTTKLTRTSFDLWLKHITRPPRPQDDPLRLAEAALALGVSLMRDPLKVARIQTRMWTDYVGALARMVNTDLAGPPVEPGRGDRRFRDDAWDDNPVFDLIKQCYLIAGQGIQELVAGAKDLDPETRQRLEFATQQVVDALSPSNFALTNPTVLRAVLDSGGRNLIEGLNNLLDDLSATGRLEVPMADATHFKVGQDLAVTPGKVVYQNELMQLIQYDATTETVHRRPLLLLPPWPLACKRRRR